MFCNSKTTQDENHNLENISLSEEFKETLETTHCKAKCNHIKQYGIDFWLYSNLESDSIKAIFDAHQLSNIANEFGTMLDIVDTHSSQTLSINAISKYTNDLIHHGANGVYDNIIGRETDINRIMQLLIRKDKNSPLLVGEVGIGKTSIVHGVIYRIINKDAPKSLQNKRILELDNDALLYGTSQDGEYENRLKSVIDEVIKQSNIILFINDIHILLENSTTVLNIIKPALNKHNLQIIGITTTKDYRKYFEKDMGFQKHFQVVDIDEPSEEETLNILRGIRTKLESYHDITIVESAVINAVKLSNRYINGKPLPLKAIELIDETASDITMELESEPLILKKYRKKIEALKIEKENLLIENSKRGTFRLRGLERELENNSLQLKVLDNQYNNEKTLLDQINKIKLNLTKLNIQREQFVRDGKMTDVASLEQGKIKDMNKLLEDTKVRLEKIPSSQRLLRDEVDADAIASMVSKLTGIQTSKMIASQRDKILHIEDYFRQDVIGQNEVLAIISKAIRRNKSGIGSPKRPIGSFMFLGTTGVGKTQVAKTVAKVLFDDDESLIRFDMSEYMDKVNVNRLVGAPPGSVGYDEGGQLTEAVKKKPYSVVLFDEVEKAHPDIFNILLQVLDDGRLTDNKGVTVNFKNTIIILTSNIGSTEINGIKDKRFRAKEVDKKVKQFFRPEFINRLDNLVIFEKLGPQEILLISDIMLREVRTALKDKEIELVLTTSAKELLAENGFDVDYGARPLRRAIHENIEDVLADMILSGELKDGQTVQFDADRKVFSVRVL
jgi:ATP-dependent Clp protease ATP-binding subunit ClpB